MAKKAYIPAHIKAHVAAMPGCVACGSRDTAECGHLIPESEGGQMIPENFVRLCSWCNRTQGAIEVSFTRYAPTVSGRISYDEALTIINVRRSIWARYCGQIRAKKQLGMEPPKGFRG